MTTVLTYSASEIIEDAFLDSGIIPPDQVPEAEDVATGFRILNRLLKLWQVNMHLWLQEEAVVFLNPGQQFYTLGPDGDESCELDDFTSTTLTDPLIVTATTIKVVSTVGMEATNFIGIQTDGGERFWSTIASVDSATEVTIDDAMTDTAAVGNSVFVFSELIDRPLRIYNGRTQTFGDDNEIPVEEWSRQEYMQQPLKSSQGIPVNMYYTPELSNGRVYVWQTAASANQLLLFTYDKPFEVTSDTASQPDIPVEWANALKWAIAKEMIPGYGVPQDKAAEIRANAVETLKEVQDNSNSSVYDLNVIPDMR